MTSVRSVVQPGWIEVTGPGLHALVAAADRHAEALGAAASRGLLPLLEALTAHGISGAPDFVVVTPGDAAVRVLVRGGGVVVLADGTRVGSDGRMPWADVDLDLAVAGDEVVVEAPEPQAPRGWRRPARLARGEAAAVPAVPAVAALAGSPADQPQPDAVDRADERGDLDRLADRVPEDDPVERGDIDRLADLVPEDDPVERGDIDQLADLDPEEAPVAEEPSVPQPDLTLPPPDDAQSLPPVARVPASPPPPGDLIDAGPWRRGGGATPDPLPRTAAMPVTPTPPPPEHPVPDVTTDRGSPDRTDDDLDGPVVLAVVCPAGHPSPPHADRCRTCDREIPPQEPSLTPRPPLGVLRISTGGVVPLDRGVLLGRAPRVDEELPSDQRPHLVRVGGADRDISRNHAEVVLEGWQVLVRDLGSTNGTTVTLPGQEPVRLRPTEDQDIEPGAVITLADEVSLTYEVEA